MATRYCGTLKLTVTLGTDSCSYRVRIAELNDDARFATLTGLRLSPFMQARIAADSSDAYTQAARAAISFAGNEDEAIYNYAECDDSGEAIISRRLSA